MGKLKIKKSEKVQMVMDKEIEISESELIDIPYHPDYKLTMDGELVSFKRSKSGRIIKSRRIDGNYISEDYIEKLISRELIGNNKNHMVNPIIINKPDMINPIVIDRRPVTGFDIRNFINKEVLV